MVMAGSVRQPWVLIASWARAMRRRITFDQDDLCKERARGAIDEGCSSSCDAYSKWGWPHRKALFRLYSHPIV